MEPRDVVRAWVDAFNRADAAMLADMYSEDAINHQVAEVPVVGQAAIRSMFASEFTRAKMVCIIENIFQDGLSALMPAVIAGHAAIAEKLLRAGANRMLRGTGAPGFAGKTAYDLAVAREMRELYDELRL